MEQQKHFLMIGDYPDDADELMAGTAVKLSRAGHLVKFVSVCDGSYGHYRPEYATPDGHRRLAERRKQEAQRSARTGGLAEYEVLDYPDCGLEPTLAAREKIIRIIRRFQPDVVISHRTCDYHADHRATAQLVMDSAYLVKVPLYCQDTPIPAEKTGLCLLLRPFSGTCSLCAGCGGGSGLRAGGETENDGLPRFPVLRMAAVG